MVQRQLQTATDAAALAAAQDLPDGDTATVTAQDYSGTPGAKNEISGVPVTTADVTLKCLSVQSAGIACSTGTGCPDPGCNAVRVTQQVSVTPWFMGVLGFGPHTVKATATASMAGGGATPLDAIVLADTTASMETKCSSNVPGIPTTSTTPTKLDCAKNAIRALLNELYPCDPNAASCGPVIGATHNVLDPVDRVGLMMFPALRSNRGEFPARRHERRRAAGDRLQRQRVFGQCHLHHRDAELPGRAVLERLSHLGHGAPEPELPARPGRVVEEVPGRRVSDRRRRRQLVDPGRAARRPQRSDQRQRDRRRPGRSVRSQRRDQRPGHRRGAGHEHQRDWSQQHTAPRRRAKRGQWRPQQRDQRPRHRRRPRRRGRSQQRFDQQRDVDLDRAAGQRGRRRPGARDGHRRRATFRPAEAVESAHRTARGPESRRRSEEAARRRSRRRRSGRRQT